MRDLITGNIVVRRWTFFWWVVICSVWSYSVATDPAPTNASRRYGAYVPQANKYAAGSRRSIYASPTPYNHGVYDLPYRYRYGLYRPWYQSYYPPSYYRYYYRPWYTVPYAAAGPIQTAPDEPCYDGCYYW